ncbi:MAG TPA: anti-sigma factor [Acidimicrobiales bacterium]
MTDTQGPAGVRPEGDGELAELRSLVARAGPQDLGETTWETPPDGLWERIAVEAGVVTGVETGGAAVPLERARERRARRAPRPWLLVAAAAAVVVLAAVAGTLVAVSRTDDPSLVASTPLDPLGAAGTGTAELVDDDGDLRLRLETADLDPGDGFLEVWVIDPEVSKLVSLGPLRPDGVYDLPAGLEPEQFPIVDVSLEPIDGDPTHSGDSLLRGELEF